MATTTATCTPSAQSPLCNTTDPSIRTSVVGSTGGAPSCLSGPPQPTPIVNQFAQMAQQSKQNNGGLARGGIIRMACGGGTSAAAATATPTQSSILGINSCQYTQLQGSGNCPTTGLADWLKEGGNKNGNPALTTGQNYYEATIGTPSCGFNTSTTGTSGSTGTSTTGTCSTGTTSTTTAAPICTAISGTQPQGFSGVPTGSVTANANQQILCQVTKCAANPTLPPGTTQTATQIQNSACQMLCPNAYNVANPGALPTATGGTAAQAPAAAPVTAATYNPCTIQNTPQMTAAQANACPNAVVSNQIQQLTQGLSCGNIPAWAQPSINWANSIMAGRGLGSSSIASQALVTAVQQAALPVAQANAQYYANLQAANLTNEQQAAVVNQQSTIQTLLSNQAAVNAGLQFNATSENQTAQFMSNLGAQINLANAAQANAMAQFNAGQTNTVGEFNANLANQINQFNAQNQLAIDQSNVTWRRNINTLNTAATNAANQTNAQNLFNLSQTDQNNLWQQFQDEASWANTDAQNALTRQQNLVIAAMGQSTAFQLSSQAGQQAFEQLLGKFGLNVAGGLLNNLGNSGSNNTNTGSNSNCSSNCTGCGSSPCISSCIAQGFCS